jgi:hypothetical protein
VSGPQRVSANAVVALKRALAVVFHYKPDLYAYASAAVDGDPTFLVAIDWTGPTYKRESVATFVDRLVREQDSHQHLLLGLLVDTANMSDFSHLARLEDGEQKVAVAKEAVAALKAVVEPYERRLRDEDKVRQTIAERRAKVGERRAIAERLAGAPRAVR